MGHAMQSIHLKLTDRRYPILPVTITSIKQALQEVKSFGCEGWKGDYQIAAMGIILRP